MSNQELNETQERIMRSARQLLQENVRLEGVTLSLESVARHADLTKPGLMYYYPTKKALLIGLVEYGARIWHDRLCQQAGGSPTEISPFNRHRAYVHVATTAEISRADYWIFSDALYHPELSNYWSAWMTPWFETREETPQVCAALTAARFIADGAWLSEASGMLRADNLAAVRAHALDLIAKAEELEAQV